MNEKPRYACTLIPAIRDHLTLDDFIRQLLPVTNAFSMRLFYNRHCYLETTSTGEERTR